MTSTTSSKGTFRQGLSFFLWSLYTGKTTMIIYLSLLTFFSTICFVFGYGITTATPGSDDQVWRGAAVFTIMITQFLSFVFTFVFSIKEFSYLHDKRKTDMFGALPVSRRTIFFSKLLAVIAQSAAPAVIITAFLAIMNRGNLPDMFGFGVLTYTISGDIPDINVWYILLKVLSGVVANAVFLGFLSICCGKTADKVLTYIIINAAYPVATALLQVLPGSFLFGYSVQINELMTFALSPYTSTISLNPLYWGIFSLVFAALSFILLPLRKAECAQSHFAFKAPLIITKVLVSFAAGIVSAYLMGLIFSMTGADKTAFCVGMLLGSFTAYFIIQIIFAKGFKGFGKGLIPYGAMITIFAVIMIIVNTGMFGYENYVPRLEDVESVSFTDSKVLLVDGKNILSGKGITDKKEIEKCLEGHREIIEYCHNQDYSIAELTFGNARNNASENYYYDILDSGEVEFTYRLKNGSTVKRYYQSVFAYDISFMDSDVYMNYNSGLFLVDPEMCSEITAMSEDYEDEFTIDGETYSMYKGGKVKLLENKDKIITALRSDIIEHGRIEGNVLYELDFSYGNNSDYSEYDCNIKVLDTYERTNSLIKELLSDSKGLKL